MKFKIFKAMDKSLNALINKQDNLLIRSQPNRIKIFYTQEEEIFLLKSTQ